MRFRYVLQAIGLTLLLSEARPASADDTELCRAAITGTERANFIPDRLMLAVGIMESGRRGPGGTSAPWPWTINVEGTGEVFDSKAAAVAAVQAHQARGARSIDVGCMQVNLMHHRAAFANLDQAFDPGTNVRYAASFLQQLLAQTGSWPRAVAGYHSLTPEIGGEYAKKVMAIWARPNLGSPDRTASSATTNAAPRPEGVPPRLPASGGAALSALPSGTAPTRMVGMGGAPAFSGRGLDSYRANPTRLLTVNLFRRS